MTEEIWIPITQKMSTSPMCDWKGVVYLLDLPICKGQVRQPQIKNGG